MPPISASGTGSYRLIRSDRAHCFDDVFVRPASRTAWRPVAYRLSPQHPTHAGCREGVAAARTDERVGFSDTSGGFAIRPQYAAAGSFAPNGLAGVRMADGGRCGYVDRTGRTVIGPRFDGAKPFGRHGAVPVRVGDLWGLIDENGEWTVEPSFPMLGPFDANGLACVLGGSAGNHFRGFPNARGEAVIEAENRLSQDFRCGLVRFDDGYAHGYLDATGAEVIEQCREWAEDSDSAPGTGLAAFVTRDGGVAHVDRDGLDVCQVVPAADGAALRPVDPAGTTLLGNHRGREPRRFQPCSLISDSRE